MPKQYAVTVEQTARVVYFVEADDEAMAEEHAAGLFPDEYDVFEGLVNYQTINVKLWGED